MARGATGSDIARMLASQRRRFGHVEQVASLRHVVAEAREQRQGFGTLRRAGQQPCQAHAGAQRENTPYVVYPLEEATQQ
jgi:hypothetical protein